MREHREHCLHVLVKGGFLLRLVFDTPDVGDDDIEVSGDGLPKLFAVPDDVRRHSDIIGTHQASSDNHP
jgi:hypothetical protein